MARRHETTGGLLRYALAAAAAAAVALVPYVTEDRYLLKILALVGVNVVIVVGLSLLFGYAGQISLGHAAFFGLGAYVSAVLVTRHGWPWLAGLAAATAASALGGLILAMPALRLKGHYLAMATLGFGGIMVVGFVELKQWTGGPDGMFGIPDPAIGPFVFDTPQRAFWLVWGFVGLALLLAANVVTARPGRALRALHATESGAAACGIDVVRAKLQVFTLSAALAGLAGSLYAHTVHFISPAAFGLSASIMLVAMVVLGGMGSLAGAVVGAVVLTLLPFSGTLLPGLSREAAAFIQDWTEDVVGLVLIGVMLFAPGGLAQAASGGRRRVMRLLRGAQAEDEVAGMAAGATGEEASA